jgi:hypothetical protein
VPQYAKPFRVPSKESSCGTGFFQKITQSITSLFTGFQQPSSKDANEPTNVFVNDYSKDSQAIRAAEKAQE